MFLHTYIPNPILFSISSWHIYWYGCFIALGFLTGLGVLLQVGKKYGFKRDELLDLTFWVVFLGLIFDRLYYVVYAWSYYRDNWIDIFKVWQGGLAIHGGIFGGILVLVWFVAYKKIKFPVKVEAETTWQKFGLLADLVVLALLAGLMIGRFGNYFNQELFGLPTDLPWGIPITLEHRPAQFVDFVYFHPTFLYESLFDGVILIILLGSHFHRFSRLSDRENNYYGNIFVGGLVLYSCGRFLNEFLRQDYSPMLLGLRWAQLVSLVIIIVGLTFLVLRHKKWYNIK